MCQAWVTLLTGVNRYVPSLGHISNWRKQVCVKPGSHYLLELTGVCQAWVTLLTGVNRYVSSLGHIINWS